MTHQPLPSPSYTLDAALVAAPREVYRDVVCADCRQPLTPEHPDLVTEDGAWKYLQAADALEVSLSGGYGMFIDNLDGDPRVLLCKTCAIALLDKAPYLAALAAPWLNLNIGHTCTDGQLHWDPMPSCPRDPDQHGWRPVYVVTATTGERSMPLAAFYTEEEAIAFADTSEDYAYHQSPISNVRRLIRDMPA